MRTVQHKQRGFSLVEMIVVVSIIGVLSAVLMPSITSMGKSSKGVVAKEMAETLNLALKKHAQVNYQFKLDPDNASTDDELAILRSLQWREPIDEDAVPGSPFVRPNWNPAGTTDHSVVRLRWNGRVFVVLEEDDDGKIVPKVGEEGYGVSGFGEPNNGSGLKVEFEATDYGENYTFPDDFVPVGG